MFGHQDDNTPAVVDAVSPSSASDAQSPAYTPAAPGVDLTPATPTVDLTQQTPEVSYTSSATDESTIPAPAAVPVTDDLLSIKQQALQQLSPLVGHLEQTPEERFRTTMMMIQASDDSSLIQTAYEAAQNIPDEKLRAQALLDVVNEINYFTNK